MYEIDFFSRVSAGSSKTMFIEEIDPTVEIVQKLSRWQRDDRFPSDVRQLNDQVMWCAQDATKYLLIVSWILHHLQPMVQQHIPFPSRIDGEFTLNLMGQFEALLYVIPTRRARVNASIRTMLAYLQRYR